MIRTLMIVLALCYAVSAESVPTSSASAEAPVGVPEFETNSLGMKFKSVPGTKVRFSIYETRVKDYQVFKSATHRTWPSANFSQGATHPAVNISWEDGMAFCYWLTEKDRKSGFLKPDEEYRLPTDEEWDVAVGLRPAVTGQGRSRDPVVEGVYPWGKNWPPQPKAGNYDQSLSVDPYLYTAPVGSFAPNSFGLYDIGGNVWEWCLDKYEESENFRVLRGASWRMRNPSDLLSSYRVGNASDLRLPAYGFRVVIAQVRK
ncbi:MAG: SUMF1/EgtB/PvdO family nonheme iron enzyme [Verrucomicrobiota bacterium]|nr:SUMF1/EgtB/PvdO family nonheme iron enzyme [Verrucomicrobiota bacterium]